MEITINLNQFNYIFIPISILGMKNGFDKFPLFNAFYHNNNSNLVADYLLPFIAAI